MQASNFKERIKPTLGCSKYTITYTQLPWTHATIRAKMHSTNMARKIQNKQINTNKDITKL